MIASIVFDMKTLRIISLFEKKTRARVKDCVITDSQILFVVNKGDLFKALGKKRINLVKLEKLFNLKIKLVEYDDNILKFVKNFIFPIKSENITFEEGVITIKGKDSKSRGILIGRNSANLKNLNTMVSKFFKIKDIKIV